MRRLRGRRHPDSRVLTLDDLRALAEATVQWINAFRETAEGWEPRPGSVAKADLDNLELGHGRKPWGPVPVETMHNVVWGMASMGLDHLHAVGLALRDDNDFGPLVMSRCALEAAGKVLWILAEGLDVRERVERSFAIRVRGAQDMLRLVTALHKADAENPTQDPELTELLASHEARVAEVLERAAELGLPVHRKGQTVVGLERGVPGGGELAYEVLKPMSVATLGNYYTVWSAAVHSTYAAISAYLRLTEPSNEYGTIGTSLNERARAACFAMLGSVSVLDAVCDYFGFERPPERIDLTAGPLAVMDRMLAFTLGAATFTS